MITAVDNARAVLAFCAFGAVHRWCCGIVSGCLVVALPVAARAACGGGGTSSLALPVVSYLRNYRAPFGVPSRLAVDAAGNVYVADPALGQVIVRAPNGRILTRFGGLERPISVAVANGGTIYVGDARAGSVTGFDREWRPILQLGQGPGEFRQPNDLAVDAATENLYVADTAAHLIKVYTAAGGFVRSFGGHGSTEGLFNFPVAVFVDAPAHQVLVADQLNYRIQVFDTEGTFLSCFGSQGSDPGQFNMLQGVSTDQQGRIYAADAVEGRVQVLDRNGAFVGYIGDFGDGRGQLRMPIGFVIDPSSRLFVAAASNARLEVFGLDTFADPETVLPAVVRVEPDPLDRFAPGADVDAYIEVPGAAPREIVPGSIVANGVPAVTSALTPGDHDSNGIPDVRVRFSRAALVGTLPVDGAAVVTVSGLLGTKQFEGSAVVQVTACGPGTICPLGDVDPQCNDAVCDFTVGCRIQPKPDGTGCEDGNACTTGDVCGGGVCGGVALRCDDGNVCTDDTCDPAAGCVRQQHRAVR
jgi:DNA-binding beta-propeller fold protein YncE